MTTGTCIMHQTPTENWRLTCQPHAETQQRHDNHTAWINSIKSVSFIQVIRSWNNAHATLCVSYSKRKCACNTLLHHKS